MYSANNFQTKMYKTGLIGLLGLSLGVSSLGAPQKFDYAVIRTKHQGMDKDNFVLLRDVKRYEGFDIKAGFYEDKSVLVIGKFNDFGESIQSAGYIYVEDTGVNGPDKRIDECLFISPTDGTQLPRWLHKNLNKLLEDVRVGYLKNPELKFEAPATRTLNAKPDEYANLVGFNRVVMRDLPEVDGYDVEVMFTEKKIMLWIGNYDSSNNAIKADGWTFAQELAENGLDAKVDTIFVKEPDNGSYLKPFEDKDLLKSLIEKAAKMRKRK